MGDDNGISSRAQDEITATGRSTIAERISAEVKAGNCACEVKNPSGKCCLGSVTRVTQDACDMGQSPRASQPRPPRNATV